MPLFAASLVAGKKTPGVSNIRHIVTTIEAANENEAIGIAVKFARHAFPTAKGFEGHDVAIQPTEKLLQPESEWGNIQITES